MVELNNSEISVNILFTGINQECLFRGNLNVRKVPIKNQCSPLDMINVSFDSFSALASLEENKKGSSEYSKR